MSERLTGEQVATEISRSLLVKDLINDLERIAGQWEQFGAYLGVPLAELKKIHNNVTGRDTLTDYCFANVINVWLESDEKNVTKEFLVKAIDNIGNHKLAVEVQHKNWTINNKNPRAYRILLALQPVKANYFVLGVQLGLKVDIIKGFEMYAGNVARCLNETINYWVRMEDDDEEDAPSKKEIFFEALESIGYVGLSQQLREKYDGNDEKKSSSSQADSNKVPQFPAPVVHPYQDKPAGYFPLIDGEKVKVGGLSFERFTQRSRAERLKEVQLSIGAVQPQEGGKKLSIAGMYGMSKWPHGICLVINNENFETLKNRKGTNVDEYNLIQTFRYLGYIVEVHRNCNAVKMQEIIEEMRQRDHNNYDSFVCCILSHGEAGQVYGSDGVLLSLNDITSRLSGMECQSLANKPKLFFLQACRGKQTDQGVRVQSDCGNSDILEEVLTCSGTRMATDSDLSIPVVNHFFFSYATPINHLSWRDTVSGSWFMSELCKSLTSYGTFTSLVDMVTRTNNEVATRYTYVGLKQAPDFHSKLRKYVFFS